MGPDNPPPMPVDPTLQAEQQKAQNDLIASLQGQAAGDTASLMARYGTRLAMSGVSMTTSPLASSPSKV